MKTFYYKAKKGPSEVIEGKMYAGNTQEVVDKLGRKGYLATLVKEEKVEENRSTLRPVFRSLFGIGLKEIITFSKQLASLLKAGLPILQALSVLGEQTHDPYFKSIIGAMAENVKNGQPLSTALKEYPNVFSPFYRAMINAGENTGSLDVSLARVSEYYSKKYELISKVRSAMAYPALILIVGIMTLAFIFINVIPKVMPLLVNLNMKLPLPTRILLASSDFLRNNWIWGAIVGTIILLTYLRARENKVFNYHFSQARLKMPILGDILLKSEITQFTKAVAMAIKSGIPIIQSVNISMPIINECAIIEEVKLSLKELEGGGSFGDGLSKSKVFPPFVYNMVKVGEKSGNLEEALLNISEAYESECEEAIKTMTTLIEPVMVLTMGLVVGFIVIAVLLPILNLNMAGV